MNLWFTVRVGDVLIPVYLPDLGTFHEPYPYLGEVARRLDEKEEDWDIGGNLPCRLRTISEAKRGSELWPLRCLDDEWRCQDCPDEVDETRVVLREGRLIRVCEKHTEPGDLRFEVEGIRTKPMTPDEISAARKEKILELRAQGLTTREIAKQLGLSQSGVAYHLKSE